MAHLRTLAKTLLLAVLAFAAAAAVTYGSDAALSLTKALLLSVILCPAVLGFVSGRFLKLGPFPTLIGTNGAPGAFAIYEHLKSGAPLGLGWVATSCLFALAGLAAADLLALRDDEDGEDMAE